MKAKNWIKKSFEDRYTKMYVKFLLRFRKRN